VKERIWIEDALKHLHEAEYLGQAATAESLAGSMAISLDESGRLLEKLQTSGLVEYRDAGHRLTDRGREYARHVVRAHRLYETYLAQETGLDEKHWHGEAEVREHAMSSDELEDMERRLGYPRFDPHGDPIPTPEGAIPPVRGIPLMEWRTGEEARIAHVEDEPPSIYERLVDLGLAAGVPIRVVETGKAGVRILAEGRSMELSPAEAAAVRAQPLGKDEAIDEQVCRLSTLRIGEKAGVAGLSPACRGPERNRLLDLGVVPGTVVTIALQSASGSPTAYRIRGAAIALRKEQADKILIRKERA
jgi:DtxR family Mn-dependent transcriptional regulator